MEHSMEEVAAETTKRVTELVLHFAEKCGEDIYAKDMNFKRLSLTSKMKEKGGF